MADESNLKPGSQSNIPHSSGKAVPKGRPVAKPAVPGAAPSAVPQARPNPRPQEGVAQARPNPKPASARVATESGPTAKPASVRTGAASPSKRQSARKSSRMDENSEYGESSSAAADKKKQMMIIGGVVGGVIFLVLILVIAAGSQQRPIKQPVDDGGGSRGAVVGFDSDNEALKKAGELHAEAGKLANQMFTAKQNDNMEEAKTAFYAARTKYDEALVIYKQLLATYTAEKGYTGLDKTIQDLSQEREDLQKEALVWD